MKRSFFHLTAHFSCHRKHRTVVDFACIIRRCTRERSFSVLRVTDIESWNCWCFALHFLWTVSCTTESLLGSTADEAPKKKSNGSHSTFRLAFLPAFRSVRPNETLEWWCNQICINKNKRKKSQRRRQTSVVKMLNTQKKKKSKDFALALKLDGLRSLRWRQTLNISSIPKASSSYLGAVCRKKRFYGQLDRFDREMGEKLQIAFFFTF